MKKLVIEKLNNENWITVEDAANLLYVKPKTLKERCRKGEYNYRVVQENKKFIYMIHKESLPINIQEEQSNVVYTNNINYSDAPNWAKMQADKYIQILKGSADLKGKKLEEYIKIWNENNPELKTSYCSILRMRRRYKKYGIKGLLAQYGKSTNKIVINNNIFNYFKKIYLDQGAPSIYSCWKNTYGYAVRHYNVELSDFPSYVTFIRRLRSEMPEQAIYLARYGKTAFNKKYGNYLQRDYSTVECGKVWVSDHAQIDVAVFDSDGNIKEFDVPYCSVYGDILQDSKGKYYTTKVDRTGCMFCMFGVHREKSPNKFEKMRETHPKLHDYCINQLGCGKVLDFLGVKY